MPLDGVFFSNDSVLCWFLYRYSSPFYFFTLLSPSDDLLSSKGVFLACGGSPKCHVPAVKARCLQQCRPGWYGASVLWSGPARVVSMSTFAFFSFGTKPALCFRAKAPKPIPCHGTGTLAYHLLSRTYYMSAVPIRHRLSGRVLASGAPTIGPGDFVL